MKMPMFSSKLARSGVAAFGVVLTGSLLMMVPLTSEAYQTVTVNGDLYACQHSCNVSIRNGTYWVTDSAGGWAARIATNGTPISGA